MSQKSYPWKLIFTSIGYYTNHLNRSKKNDENFTVVEDTFYCGLTSLEPHLYK